MDRHADDAEDFLRVIRDGRSRDFEEPRRLRFVAGRGRDGAEIFRGRAGDPPAFVRGAQRIPEIGAGDGGNGFAFQDAAIKAERGITMDESLFVRAASGEREPLQVQVKASEKALGNPAGSKRACQRTW